MELPTHLPLALRLTMNGTILPIFPYVPLGRGQRQLHLLRLPLLLLLLLLLFVVIVAAEDRDNVVGIAHRYRL
jgi:hypothetical protein